MYVCMYVCIDISHCPGSGFEKKIMPIRETITGLSMLPRGTVKTVF